MVNDLFREGKRKIPYKRKIRPDHIRTPKWIRQEGTSEFYKTQTRRQKRKAIQQIVIIMSKHKISVKNITEYCLRNLKKGGMI